MEAAGQSGRAEDAAAVVASWVVVAGALCWVPVLFLVVEAAAVAAAAALAAVDDACGRLKGRRGGGRRRSWWQEQRDGRRKVHWDAMITGAIGWIAYLANSQSHVFDKRLVCAFTCQSGAAGWPLALARRRLRVRRRRQHAPAQTTRMSTPMPRPKKEIRAALATRRKRHASIKSGSQIQISFRNHSHFGNLWARIRLRGQKRKPASSERQTSIVLFDFVRSSVLYTHSTYTMAQWPLYATENKGPSPTQ